jgi:hypothetical protein
LEGEPINTVTAQVWCSMASAPCDDAHAILLRQHPGYWLPHRIVKDVSPAKDFFWTYKKAQFSLRPLKLLFRHLRGAMSPL